jgi:Ca2+:H+ antiporter
MARSVSPLKILPWLLFPAALLAGFLHAPPLVRFALAGAALLPLATLLGEATEQLASRMGPVAAGLLNATCGNAAELIIAVLALRQGLVGVVQASLTGSIIGNLLLVLGAAAVAGGVRHKVQRFSGLAAESQLASLALAVVALLVPAVFFHFARLSHREDLAMPLSLAVSGVLLVVYAAALLFSLKTHKHLLSGDHPMEAPHWSARTAVLALLGSGVATALVSEVLVGSVEEVGHALGLGPVFMGVVIVAVLGNAAEHAAAIQLAWRNHMDAALSVCFASSLQVALFVTPVLVFGSLLLGHPMTLVFSGIEVISVALAVCLTGLVTLNGETNWLEGVQLLALYLILAACLALLPAPDALLPL